MAFKNRTRLVPTRVAARALFCLSLASLAGCQAKRFDDPINVMTSPLAAPDAREDAMAQAARELPRDPRRIEALNQIVWDNGYPDDQKIMAIDQLVEFDPDAFRINAAKRLPLIKHWAVIDHILSLAVSRKWPDYTPVVVRQYARPAKGIDDKDRPERAYIQRMNPGRPVETVIFEVFANADDGATIQQQTGAWELLCRLCPREQVVAMLGQGAVKTPLSIDLKAGLVDLGVLPRNQEGILWLMHLRNPARQAWWDRAKSAVARLRPEQAKGLELRHLPILLHASDRELAMTRDELVLEVDAWLKPQKHYLSSPAYDGEAPDHPQLFSQCRDQLSWADLLTLHLLKSILADPTLIHEFFEQADADRVDTSTEYGGALDWLDATPSSPARCCAVGYTPQVRLGDLKYITSQALIERVYTSIAHYHFHAQDEHNADVAGPGRGDLDLAGRININGLVITFIDHDRVNIDYYQAGGIVVDLGTYHR